MIDAKMLARMREADPEGEVVLLMGEGRRILGQILAVSDELVTVRPKPEPGRALEPAQTVRVSSVKEVRTHP